MNTPTVSYKNHRFPPQIIARTVWHYFRFPPSLRLVEEMLLEHGIVVSYETIRRWGRKFGRTNCPATTTQESRRIVISGVRTLQFVSPFLAIVWMIDVN
jgi:putative transposase